jgi:DNA (cytosine-5)-methyltransferase 1
MNHLGLFEGIGGFSLAARWMGWKTLAWCEWNEFGQKVLRHHFPEAEGFGDITKTDFTKYANRIDILTGGFPCQPYSLAGKRKGKEDERHLWPEMLRAIREVQPRWVVGENVGGLINWNGGMVFNEVQADLEAAGYEVWPYVLPACAVNAPHRRDRVWFIAYSANNGHTNRHKGTGSEERSGEQRGVQQLEGMGRERAASNPNRNPTRTSGEGASIEGIGGSNDVQQSERGSKTELNNRPSSVPRDVTHPNCNGLNGSNSKHEVNTGEGWEYAQRNIEQMGRDVTHACQTGLQGCKEYGSVTGIGENGNKQFAGCFPPTWQNFPTQSPIRFGDDGISSRLDGITFSKWRNESIKAAGNAIVPQVALQIFKAIQQMQGV